MKILNRSVATVYRFRCDRCRSVFEMTEEEKLENDRKFTDDWLKLRDKDLPVEQRFVSNNLNKFDCPVCNCVRYAHRGDMHRYKIMEDGTEFKEY